MLSPHLVNACSADLAFGPIAPKAKAAPQQTAGALSSSALVSAGTAVAAAGPIAPRASAASRRISGFTAVWSNSVSAGAASAASGPISANTRQTQ